MATVVGAPAGTSDIAGSFARAGGSLGKGLGSFLLQQRQRQQQQQQQQFLQQFALQQGIQVPGNLPPGFLQDFLLGRQQQQGALGLAQARRPLPTPGQFQVNQAQQISQIPENQRTEEQKEILRVAQGLPTTTKELSVKAQAAKNFAGAEKLRRESGGELSTEQKFKQANIFRKDFDSLSGEFRKVRDSFERVKVSAANPSPAGDLSLIFNFMKMLDPGSVVRESEFANAAATGAFGERLKAAGLLILEGVRLSPNMRKDFLNRSKSLFNAQQKTQKKLVVQFTNRSKRLGINPADVITAIDINVPNPLANQLQEGEILVKDKATGQIGALPESEFDPNSFERVK